MITQDTTGILSASDWCQLLACAAHRKENLLSAMNKRIQYVFLTLRSEYQNGILCVAQSFKIITGLIYQIQNFIKKKNKGEKG
jgi:hypothetical protein